MVISNSSSSSITSSTMSRESAPISSWNEVLRVTCSLLTPKLSHTIWIMRSSVVATTDSSQSDSKTPSFTVREFTHGITHAEHRRPRSRPGSQQRQSNAAAMFMYHTRGCRGKGGWVALLNPGIFRVKKKQYGESGQTNSAARRFADFVCSSPLEKHENQHRVHDHHPQTDQDDDDGPNVPSDRSIRRLVLVREKGQHPAQQRDRP